MSGVSRHAILRVSFGTCSQPTGPWPISARTGTRSRIAFTKTAFPEGARVTPCAGRCSSPRVWSCCSRARPWPAPPTATCASARRRRSRRPTRSRRSLAIAVESYATVYYDQLGGIKLSDQSADYSSALAQSVETAPDGKTITFHLRKDVHWSDGKPFTSADALWTFNAVLNNKTNQLHSTIEAVKSVSAPDADTFVLHLSTRDSEFLAKLAIPILPAHVWSKIPTNRLDKVDGPIPAVTTARLRAHEVGEERHHDPDAERRLRRRPQRRQAARGQAHPDHLLRESGLDLPGRRPGQAGLRLQRARGLGAPDQARPESRRPARSPRRAAATGRSRSTPARPRARRSAAGRARA